jgi:hypoxanthine phosphoribosyltransferase
MSRGSDPAVVLVEAAELRARVQALAARIAADYRTAARPLVAIGILKGSTVFLADLVRALAAEVEVDFMAISSYGRAEAAPGTVRILKDLDGDIAGRDVLIVEDIVDTGLTLSYLRKTLLARAPRSVRTAALLDKSARRIVPVPIEYRGFEISDVFVVGYGLDWEGRGRNLRMLVGVRDPASSSTSEVLARLLDARL